MNSARGSENAPGRIIAALIRRYREAAGLAQTELAERAEVSRSRIIDAEAGTSLPTMKVCLKLARSLNIPAAVMVRALINDSIVEADPSALQELVGTDPIEGGSAWETLAQHQGLRVEEGYFQGILNADGDSKLLRQLSKCIATRERRRIVFRERIVGERPPAFAVKGSPKGFGYSLHVSIEGEWALHHVEFHRPWTEADGPFDFQFEITLPRAFVLDRDEYNRRRTSEGLAPRPDWKGDWRLTVNYAFERIKLDLQFPETYAPIWEKPTAAWGTAPIDDVDYHEADERTCKSATSTAGGNKATLTVERPVPGYTFGIRWTPVAWEPPRGAEK